MASRIEQIIDEIEDSAARHRMRSSVIRRLSAIKKQS